MPELKAIDELSRKPMQSATARRWPFLTKGMWHWAASIIRQATAYPVRLALLLAFVTIWTVELFVVQKLTLVPPQAVGDRFALFAPLFRLCLDLGFVSLLTLLLRRRWLAVMSILVFGGHVALLTFYHYFHRPLSLLTLRNNWNEGIEAAGLGLQVVPDSVWWWVGGALVVKLALLIGTRGEALPRGARFQLAGIIAVCYVGLSLIGNYFDPPRKILTSRGVARLGVIRGYAQTWLAEEYYLGSREILERAIAERKLKLDRLTPIEGSFRPGKRIIVIQAESLDFTALGYRTDGQELTPFLNRLREQSMFYRIQAMHFNGSADADFSALNGVRPSRHVMNYNIPGYPYQDTLPQFLQHRGFHTVAIHGNMGNFYKRRRAYSLMGFDELIFEEELVGRYHLPSAQGLGVLDRHVLNISRQLFKETEEPALHFIITLTSHTPFNLVPLSEQELYPGTGNYAQRYFNSIRYLDRALQEYIEGLPKDTTVMIYGDHAAGVSQGDYRSDRERGRDFVPCLFFKQGYDLSKVQKTRDQAIARDGSLTLLDMTAYLRAQIAADSVVEPAVEPTATQ